MLHAKFGADQLKTLAVHYVHKEQKQTDRQTDRQTDKHTDRHTDIFCFMYIK